MIRARQVEPAGEGTPQVRDHDLDLSEIKLDQSAQPREALNNDRISEYADAMKAGDQFPPLTVFHDGSTYWLADGFHRHYAAQHAGRKHIRCHVRQGGLRDAILWSVGANAKHGLARSDEDKKRAVMRLLDDAEWSTWTDRDIARRCHVSHPFVAKVRKTHAGDTGNASSMERTYVHPKTGKPTTMKTAGVNASRKNAREALVNDEPPPEVGPQAEAFQSQGTGAGTLADREGRHEGEAASVDLPTIQRNIVAEILALWAEANADQRAEVLAAINPSSENTSRPQHEVRPGSTSLGTEQQCDTLGVTAGETATNSPSDGGAFSEVKGEAQPENAAGVEPSSSDINPQADSSPEADKAEASTSSPSASATNFTAMSKADQIRLLRPHCQHPNDLEKCGGSGRNHCHGCKKLMAESEAA
ncbi:MAG: ParB/RepB/Spo0J family partition protein [Mesorhizobium sp.]